MRKATSKDVAQITWWFKEYFDEAQQIMGMNVKLDLRTVRAFFEKTLGQRDLISYIGEDGVIMGELGHTWWGPNTIANGGIWYVTPEARNGIFARALLKAFDEEAAARGAVYSRMALDNPAHVKAVEGLYHLAGYQDYSKIYVKEFKNGIP